MNSTVQDWIRHKASRQREEIERAVLEVKHGPVQRRRWNEVSRWNYRGGRFWNDRERPRLRTPQYDEAIMHEMVRVRGRVPRVFFEWFKHQTETDWKARKMLRQCLFEER